ncbi:MAG TPA: NADH-quinone oxidoreductase subunit C [Burkholderiaceae bacterium]|nr:NADH-quinone oxidoreductase subunit C [Burkholderiaceae bacterium]
MDTFRRTALFERLPGAMPVWTATVDGAQWMEVAREVTQRGGRLVSLWGTDVREPSTSSVQDPGPDHGDRDEDFVVYAAYAVAEGLACVRLPLPVDGAYPDLAPLFPAARRMQRATFDMLGIPAQDAAQRGDTRPWLRHGAWPADYFPLRREHSGRETFDVTQEDYPFVRVAGDGVHEIPVGPIHAGIIEPGHFRFSIVGEKVLRLEERLGYVHKGIEKRFEQLPLADGHRLAGRVSGDSTVAYAWAWCMALESATATTIPPRAAALRALLLERERVANHLGDLGALANDAALAFGLAQFSRLRESWLRLNRELFGHRLLMDRIVPGGVAVDLHDAGAARLLEQRTAIEAEVAALKAIYDEHAGLQDRFMATGIVTPQLAAQLGLCGLAGRASGQAHDLRVEFPCPPYDRLEETSQVGGLPWTVRGVKMATQDKGDVAARVEVRFQEVFESLRLIRLLLAALPSGAIENPLPPLAREGFGIGWVEGWRGEILVVLEVAGGADGPVIRRCHCHDPSWQNWPVLEHAVIGNIVPDFPLINKSFNLSYSGQDL